MDGTPTTVTLGQTPGGQPTANGAVIIRYEWAGDVLWMVTTEGDYSIPMSYDRFLEFLGDD